MRLVKRLIEEVDPTARIAVTAELGAHVEARRLADVDSLERGTVVQVDDDVYLTPYLVDNEYMSYILPGTHGHVVSLLDPDSAEDRTWIDKERALLAAYDESRSGIDALVRAGRYAEGMKAFADAFGEPVHRFFEKVFVNVEDLVVRANRLALVGFVNSLIAPVADLSDVDRGGGAATT